jgi:hypothetical protein
LYTEDAGAGNTSAELIDELSDEIKVEDAREQR